MDSQRGGRMVLVIASQAGESFEHELLSFVPPLEWDPGQILDDRASLAVDLYEQFLDPMAGDCHPVPGLEQIEGIRLHSAGSSLVINPTISIAEKALVHAFVRSEKAQVALVVHYLGHGFVIDGTGQHVLGTVDSKRNPAEDGEAWNPYQKIRQLLPARKLAGFVFLVDACHAAIARKQIVEWGVKTSTFAWIGSSQDAEAFDGCFTSTLVELMRDGDGSQARPPAELNSSAVCRRVDQACRFQKSDQVASMWSDLQFVTRNRRVNLYEEQLGLVGDTARRLRAVTPDAYQVVDTKPITAALEQSHFVVVTGNAGTGKTALCAALRDPPAGFDARRVDAVAFCDESTNSNDLADALAPQLQVNAHYNDAARKYEQTNHDLQTQGPFQRKLSGPLALLDQNDHFQVAIDGLDQLGDTAATTIGDITSLVDTLNGRLQVIATSRRVDNDGPDTPGAHQVAIAPLTTTQAHNYLSRFNVPLEARNSIVGSVDELNWLVLRLAADQYVTAPDTAVLSDPTAMYHDILTNASAALGAAALESVTDILVATGKTAGPGPQLPFPIFAAAVKNLGGPQTIGDLTRILAYPRLYRIIERTNPAGLEDHLGLFHPTAIKALEPTPERLQAAHKAITTVLDNHAVNQ